MRGTDCQSAPSLAAWSSAETVSDAGVGTPWRRPRRPITPLRASHSRARPATRSVRIEEPASFGSASSQAMTSSASRPVSSTPSARATAAHSCASARATSRTSSNAKISAGRPASAITPETALAHSLRQASRSKAPPMVTSACAPSSAASPSPAAPAGTARRRASRWRTRPGATGSTGHQLTTGRTATSPTSGPTRSTWSMPFCRTATVLRAPHSADSHPAAPAVWWAFTASRTQSAARSTAAGSVSNGPGTDTSDPSGSSTVTSSNARRPHSSSSWPPADCTAAAIAAPIAPTPTTATRAIAALGRRAREQRLLAGQRRARGRVDLDRHDLARRREAGEVHRLAVARATADARGVGARRALDEHVERAPDEALGALVGAALDHLDQALHPLDLDLVRDEALGQQRRLGPAPGREDEGEGAVVADLLADLERLREVLLGLAREADDDVGGDGAVGHVLADERDAVQVAPAVVRAAHRLEDRTRPRLQRQVDVLAHRRELRMGADDVLAHVLGVRARVAQAVEPRDRVQGAQQLGEGAALGTQVAPVGVDVLAQQGDLARAVGDLGADLVDELVERPRDLQPARGGNDAVRAAAVAADRDLHPGLELARALGRQVAGEALELEVALRGQRVGGQELGELVDLAGAEGDVDERELAEDVVLDRLRPAAADADDDIGPRALDALGLMQVRDEAAVGRLADRAGVEED